MRSSTRQTARQQGGFTTVELMIALVILAVVVVQTLALFASQQRNYHEQERVVAAQEDARLAADMMLSDVRMAGFLVAEFAGISSRDGGAAAADVLCVSDPDVLAEARVASATARFDRAVISGAVSDGDSFITISAGHGDIDGDGSVDFSVGSGVIISDGSASHCATVTAVAATRLDFSPATPSGFAIPVLAGRAVPANIYQLTTAGLERNGQLLTSQVEDVQVEFGLDTNGDGEITGGEFPNHDISAADTNIIRLVRLSVLTRTRREDPEISSPGRQQVANRSASGTPDGFRRRLAVLQAAPRNLL